MILIDSLYINNSGGKVLLDYLVSEVERSALPVFYLFDDRCIGEYSDIPTQRKVFIKASLLNRLKFYQRHEGQFSKIFCFANIPPPIKLKNSLVFTYFHNVLLAGSSIDYLRNRLFGFFLKNFIIRFYRDNTSFWLVQSLSVKSKLEVSFSLKEDKIVVYPFFKLDNLDDICVERIVGSFCYISNAPPHKNHQRLLQAWELLLSRGFRPILNLTIPFQYKLLNREIERINLKGARIINHGLVSKQIVNEIYCKSEYLVYPSLFESFGLPLIEAIHAGCKVIASDLEYVDEIVYPSSRFDPLNVSDIVSKVESCLSGGLTHSSIKIHNRIREVIDLLS